MPITIHWYDDTCSILIFDFIERWAWRDLLHASVEGRTFLDTVAHPVHIVGDFTAAHTLPRLDLLALNDLAISAKVYTHSNTTLIYVVGTQRQLTALARIMLQMFPRIHPRYRFVPTLQDVLSQINRVGDVGSQHDG